MRTAVVMIFPKSLCIVSVVERCDLTDIKGKIYLFIYFRFSNVKQSTVLSTGLQLWTIQTSTENSVRSSRGFSAKASFSFFEMTELTK